MKNIPQNTQLLIFNYLICISSYRLAKDIYQAVANLLPGEALSNRTLHLVVMVYFAYFMMFLCGLAMGFLSKQRVILHAFIATTASVAFDIYIVTQLATGGYRWALFMLANGAILGGLGGATALLLKRVMLKTDQQSQS